MGYAPFPHPTESFYQWSNIMPPVYNKEVQDIAHQDGHDYITMHSREMRSISDGVARVNFSYHALGKLPRYTLLTLRLTPAIVWWPREVNDSVNIDSIYGSGAPYININNRHGPASRGSFVWSWKSSTAQLPWLVVDLTAWLSGIGGASGKSLFLYNILGRQTNLGGSSLPTLVAWGLGGPRLWEPRHRGLFTKQIWRHTVVKFEFYLE